jgi:hypothetical protein
MYIMDVGLWHMHNMRRQIQKKIKEYGRINYPKLSDSRMVLNKKRVENAVFITK